MPRYLETVTKQHHYFKEKNLKPQKDVQIHRYLKELLVNEI